MGSEFDASKELEAKVHREAQAIMMRLRDAIAAVTRAILDDRGTFTHYSGMHQRSGAAHLTHGGEELVKACLITTDSKGSPINTIPTDELLKLVMGRMI